MGVFSRRSTGMPSAQPEERAHHVLPECSWSQWAWVWYCSFTSKTLSSSLFRICAEWRKVNSRLTTVPPTVLVVEDGWTCVHVSVNHDTISLVDLMANCHTLNTTVQKQIVFAQWCLVKISAIHIVQLCMFTL